MGEFGDLLNRKRLFSASSLTRMPCSGQNHRRSLESSVSHIEPRKRWNSVDAERERLRQMLQAEAVKVGDFILSSGKRASYYIDCRLVTLSAEGAYLTGNVLLRALDDPLPDAVAGMSVAADPVVTAVAIASFTAGTPLSALIVRSQAKGYGTGKQVEGPLQPGMRVAILEDTVSTGASVLRAAEAVEKAGGVVTGICTLVDRLQGGAAAITSAGYAYRHVFAIEDLGVEPTLPMS